MAINKQKELKSGFVASHFHLYRVSVVDAADGKHLLVDGLWYKDEESKTPGNHVDSDAFSFQVGLEDLGTPILTLAHSKLLSLPEFSGGVVV